MSAEPLRGILPVLVTPFDASLIIDEESLRAQVAFSLAAGVRGLVTTAISGEFFTLSDRERRQVVEIVVAENAGRLPVIATVNGVSAAHAVELTRDAAEAGADAVMAMPPYFARLPPDGVVAYFKAIATETPGPIVLQNAGGAPGAPVSPELLGRLFDEIPELAYVKEEVPPNSHNVGATAARLTGQALGVFGGDGGLYMVGEHRRGATGNMPATEFLELTVRIFDLLAAGDEGAARTLHIRLLAALTWRRPLGLAATKRVLQRRGIIRCAASRAPFPQPDAEDERELDILLSELQDVLTYRGPFTVHATAAGRTL
jgi:4-hydroxy-tetrahydrodipicolinate synthase